MIHLSHLLHFRFCFLFIFIIIKVLHILVNKVCVDISVLLRFNTVNALLVFNTSLRLRKRLSSYPILQAVHFSLFILCSTQFFKNIQYKFNLDNVVLVISDSKIPIIFVMSVAFPVQLLFKETFEWLKFLPLSHG